MDLSIACATRFPAGACDPAHAPLDCTLPCHISRTVICPGRWQRVLSVPHAVVPCGCWCAAGGAGVWHCVHLHPQRVAPLLLPPLAAAAQQDYHGYDCAHVLARTCAQTGRTLPVTARWPRSSCQHTTLPTQSLATVACQHVTLHCEWTQECPSCQHSIRHATTGQST